MVLKCKICGGDLAYEVGNRIATCEYCGSKQTLPQTASDEKIAVMYERANGYRLANEFDKAANIYEQLIAENNRDGEAYWNLALCNYGVVYVQDPKTGEYIPTCNRTHYLSILKDENYLKALEYATPEQVALYEKDAGYIDEVQKGIVAIAKGEKPFDIFICYKETGENGKRSKDSVKAQNLYEKLTEAGYKVFFSRVTLESKIGTEYEPYIYAAIASSKIMLHITSSKEHSEAVWVKNEWSRYLALSAKNSDKTMIPLFFGMSKDELPDEFTHLPSYNMDEDGFEQELLRGIKKLIPTPIMKLKARKRRNRILRWVGAAALVCLVAAGIIAYPQYKNYKTKMVEYDAAMQLYYDKNYPEATWAFEAMKGFKDSKEMREKAALSWRKSLATVAVETAYYEIYYITQNGTVDTAPFFCDENPDRVGVAHQEIKPGSHGEVVSIASDLLNRLYALHEDGYVSNAAELNGAPDDSAWHDIIKISDKFLNTNVALRADGTMVFQYSEAEGERGSGYESYYLPDHWMNEMKTWTEIVDFSYEGYCSDGFNYAYVLGIKADGTLCIAGDFSNIGDNGYFDAHSDELIKNFKNVATADLQINRIYQDQASSIECIAHTKEGTTLFCEYTHIYDCWESPENAQYSIGTITENGFQDELSLKKNGDLIDSSSNSIILKDCVYYTDTFAVTRSGTIYHYRKGFGNLEFHPFGKTVIYDEWLERLE